MHNKEFIQLNSGHAARLDDRILLLATIENSGYTSIPQAKLLVLLTQVPELVQNITPLLVQELITTVTVITTNLDLIKRATVAGKTDRINSYQQKIATAHEHALEITAFLKKNKDLLTREQIHDVSQRFGITLPGSIELIEEKIRSIL